jgi:hypothetical protein
MIYKCLICFSVIYLLMLGFIVFKKFIKPRLEVEHYLDYSPFDPLNEDSESYKHEKEKYYLYNQIQRKILETLINKSIIKKDPQQYSDSYIVLPTAIDNLNKLNTFISPNDTITDKYGKLKDELIELMKDYYNKRDTQGNTFNDSLYYNNTYAQLLSKIGDDIKKDDSEDLFIKSLINRLKDIKYEHEKLKENPDTQQRDDKIINNIINYLLKDVKIQIEFLEGLKKKPLSVNKNYNIIIQNMILKLISVGYIERKVEEINTYFTSKDDTPPRKSYIDLKIREYIKLMNVTGLFNTLIEKIPNFKRLTRDQAKIKIIKDNLYKDNNDNTVTGYIYEQYIKKSANIFTGLTDITKIYTDISKTHNKYDPDIPVRELEVILKQIKIKNNTLFTLKNGLDIFEKEKKDIRYELKNERLIKEIIDNEIMKNINKKTHDRKSTLYKGHDDYINKKNKNSYRDTKSGIKQKDLYKMFETEYPETYKYLNHSITSFKKTANSYKLTLNTRSTQSVNWREYIITPVIGECKKSPSSRSEVNLCDPYLVEIELEIYKEYTNDVYKIHFELLVFDDYILPTFEEKMGDYNESDEGDVAEYNKNEEKLANQYEELIRNKIYIFEKYDILSTYRRDMYISNDTAINRNDDRLKYENYDKHYTHNHYHGINHHISEEPGDPHNKHNRHRFHSHEHSHDGASDMQTKRSKYYGDPAFINKLLCEKKRKSEELLHNYFLVNDKFKAFSKDRTLQF